MSISSIVHLSAKKAAIFMTVYFWSANILLNFLTHYDAMFENTLNGMSICCALFLSNPEEKALFNEKEEFLNNEFIVPNDLLIAPVI